MGLRLRATPSSLTVQIPPPNCRALKGSTTRGVFSVCLGWPLRTSQRSQVPGEESRKSQPCPQPCPGAAVLSPALPAPALTLPETSPCLESQSENEEFGPDDLPGFFQLQDYIPRLKWNRGPLHGHCPPSYLPRAPVPLSSLCAEGTAGRTPYSGERHPANHQKLGHYFAEGQVLVDVTILGLSSLWRKERALNRGE